MSNANRRPKCKTDQKRAAASKEWIESYEQNAFYVDYKRLYEKAQGFERKGAI